MKKQYLFNKTNVFREKPNFIKKNQQKKTIFRKPKKTKKHVTKVLIKGGQPGDF